MMESRTAVTVLTTATVVMTTSLTEVVRAVEAQGGKEVEVGMAALSLERLLDEKKDHSGVLRVLDSKDKEVGKLKEAVKDHKKRADALEEIESRLDTLGAIHTEALQQATALPE